MRVTSYVQQRKTTGIYELRYPVPDELRGMVGKQYHYKSLRTHLKPEANRRGAAEIERFEAQELAAARRKLHTLQGNGSSPNVVTTAAIERPLLDPAEIDAAFARWKEAELGRRWLAIANELIPLPSAAERQPPGLARLTTWPLPIGSAWVVNTIGIVEVAVLAALA